MDGATVSKGFCTSFCLQGLKAYCGYTGHRWSARHPFNALMYEKMLDIENKQRATIGDETREQRIQTVVNIISDQVDLGKGYTEADE